jgi:nicotinamidase-related amidase
MQEESSSALVIIDPQNDFCDQRGRLYVDGASADIARLAAHIERNCENYSDIFVSLDSHDVTAIFHPRFWADSNGCAPAPYTSITQDDFLTGRWQAASATHKKYAAKTFSAMRSKNIDAMTVWPEHCIVSTWGHQIADRLRDALSAWREMTGRAVRYIFKGENPYTDQFSIFEGLDDSWPETAFNEPLFARLSEFISVTFAGEALSHCVGASILSYTKRLTELGQIKGQRLRLLEDCTSAVSGFDCQRSIDRLTAAGVTCVTATS